MKDKIRLFNEKQHLVNTAVSALRQKLSELRHANERDSAYYQKFTRILHNLNWIERTIAKVKFDLDEPGPAEDKLTVYTEIADYTLGFLYQVDKDFKGFYDNSSIYDPSSSIEGLNSSLDVFVLIVKVLAYATLLLAAVPTILVTMLPAFFSAIVNLITPLLFLLPAMTMATCAVGGLLLGLKLTQMGIEKYAQVNENSPESYLQTIKHNAADKLLDSHQSVQQLGQAAATKFFSSVPVLDSEFFEASSNHVSIR